MKLLRLCLVLLVLTAEVACGGLSLLPASYAHSNSASQYARSVGLKDSGAAMPRTGGNFSQPLVATTPNATDSGGIMPGK